MKRLFDLRFVIGIFFLVVGALLFGYSFIVPNSAANGRDVNLWCGVFFIFFAVFMLTLAFKDKSETL